jgi:hypothetical protein
MAIGPSLRGTLGTYLPTWLGNIPGLRNLFSILWTTALLGDALREIAWEGQLAAYPGVGTPSALPLIGVTRGLVQGPAEPNLTFAARLIAWLPTLAQLGSPQGLVLQVQAYLIGQGSLGAGVYPVVSFVDRAGNMTTANANQTITQSEVSWDWDELGGWTDNVGHKPANVVDGYWSDGWLIIQDPFTHYTGFSDPNWLAAWNSGDQTVDSLCTQEVVTGLQAIVGFWKGVHVYTRCIVWCPNPAAYTPNGYQGNFSINNSGTQTAARNGAYAYWQPPFG